MKGGISDNDVPQIANEWEDRRLEEDLDPQVVAKEVEKVANKFEKYNVPTVGDVPTPGEDNMF